MCFLGFPPTIPEFFCFDAFVGAPDFCGYPRVLTVVLTAAPQCLPEGVRSFDTKKGPAVRKTAPQGSDP